MTERELYVVMDASGRKILGKVYPGDLENWSEGHAVAVDVHEPILLIENHVATPQGLQMQCMVTPLDALDPGVDHVTVAPTAFYEAKGRQLAQRHEGLTQELRAKSSNIQVAHPGQVPNPGRVPPKGLVSLT